MRNTLDRSGAADDDPTTRDLTSPSDHLFISHKWPSTPYRNSNFTVLTRSLSIPITRFISFAHSCITTLGLLVVPRFHLPSTLCINYCCGIICTHSVHLIGLVLSSGVALFCFAVNSVSARLRILLPFSIVALLETSFGMVRSLGSVFILVYIVCIS